jgi:hypothetical protein
MSRARFGRMIGVRLCSAALALGACRSEPTKKRDPSVLDGVELSAARRVGLETASEAIQKGDVKKLKMLAVWVRKRAQVVLFEPDDLAALDIAITCLDGSLPEGERAAALAKISSGKLVQDARDVCLDQEQ